MKHNQTDKTASAPETRNDPNVNYGMYEQDRVAKRNAQPATGEGNAPREVSAIRRNRQSRNKPINQ